MMMDWVPYCNTYSYEILNLNKKQNTSKCHIIIEAEIDIKLELSKSHETELKTGNCHKVNDIQN